MRKNIFLASIYFLLSMVPIAAVSATGRAQCAVTFAKLNPATPISIDEAKQLTVSAWNSTARYLRKNGIQATEENQAEILNVFDRALSHAMTPLGPARNLRNESGLRVVDAPHLETLRAQGVPDYVIRHLTVDHHGSFGVGLPANVNSTTQILDLLDPQNPRFVPANAFDRGFKKFASDNVGDAFGLARSVVRHADEIRRNPRLRERLRQIAVAEDFGIFGPALEMSSSDTVPALLRMNDRMLDSIGSDRTFMDRVNLGFKENTAKAISKAGDDYDRVLFPKNEADRSFVKKLAVEFRKNVESGISQAEKIRVPLTAKSGRPAPIFFADATSLGDDTAPFFQSRLVIPQLVRKLEKSGSAEFERNFNIVGDSGAPTRTVICANFPSRGTSMIAVPTGQNQSFVQAFIAAEKKAIEARLPSLRLSGGEVLQQAEARHVQIEQGKWMPQNLPNGNLIFGSTYMNAAEFRILVEQNLELLGYP